jgi:hypothetical protein
MGQFELRRDVKRLQQRGEQRDDALNGASELLKRWEKRLTLQNLRLVERYAECEIDICVHRVTRNPPEQDGAHNYALSLFGSQDRRRVRPSRRVSKGADVGHQAIQVENDVLVGLRYGEQEAVLIDNVEVVQGPQGGIASLVWLETVKDVQRLLADAICLSRSAGFVLGFGRPQREGGCVGRLAAVGDHKLVDKMVEGRPQIVDDISGLKRERGWQRIRSGYYPFPVPGLRVVLDRDFVAVGLAKSLDSSVEIAEVVLGPIDL